MAVFDDKIHQVSVRHEVHDNNIFIFSLFVGESYGFIGPVFERGEDGFVVERFHELFFLCKEKIFFLIHGIVDFDGINVGMFGSLINSWLMIKLLGLASFCDEGRYKKLSDLIGLHFVQKYKLLSLI